MQCDTIPFKFNEDYTICLVSTLVYGLLFNTFEKWLLMRCRRKKQNKTNGITLKFEALKKLWNQIEQKRWLTTSWSFFFETVIVFVDEIVDVVLETFDVLTVDPDTDTVDILNAVEYLRKV